MGKRVGTVAPSHVSLRNEVLLLGCEGAGKTLLCRHLDLLAGSRSGAALQTKTQPSIGVELLDLTHLSLIHI